MPIHGHTLRSDTETHRWGTADIEKPGFLNILEIGNILKYLHKDVAVSVALSPLLKMSMGYTQGGGGVYSHT